MQEQNKQTTENAVSRTRKRILWQAALAVLTLVMTGVIVFGITAAWYSNVVHTGGLIFEVEKWGVDVDAVVHSNTIKAAPGRHGVISLEVHNASSNMVTTQISITKNSMDVQMQKRLYFYVDGQQTKNAETMGPVYLNSQHGYDYTLLGNSSLHLTEEYHNDAQLKWMWVYDVLGYYVLAQATADGAVTDLEYLQPIEYNFNFATFTADGRLKTVDGRTTAAEFLADLSKTDGYPGTITGEGGENGYYPVAVDETGYGVYVYLCTYDEIMEANLYDTELGKAAAEGEAPTFAAKITIYAENVESQSVSVDNMQALLDALDNQSVDMIRLNGDITSEQAVHIASGQKKILDLNGHILTTNTAEAAFRVEEKGSLTVINGTLTGAEGSGNAFAAVGAQIVLDRVNLSGYEMGVRIADNDGTGTDSMVRITGCDFNTNDCAVLVYGNGTASEQKSTVVISNSKLYSNDVVICGNGTASGTGRWGTDIQIVDSTIVSNPENVAGGIYQPQMNSTLNIYNSTVAGYTGIAVKGGTVIITDSDIIGTGNEPKDGAFAISGYTDTAAGVYVETSYGYEIRLEIYGDSNLSSYYGKGLLIFEENADCVTVIRDGGTVADAVGEPQE